MVTHIKMLIRTVLVLVWSGLRDSDQTTQLSSDSDSNPDCWKAEYFYYIVQPTSNQQGELRDKINRRRRNPRIFTSLNMCWHRTPSLIVRSWWSFKMTSFWNKQKQKLVLKQKWSWRGGTTIWLFANTKRVKMKIVFLRSGQRFTGFPHIEAFSEKSSWIMFLLAVMCSLFKHLSHVPT